MDLSGNILLSRTMHQDGMGSVAQYWLNGYDESAIKSYASLMQGVYFLIGHVPFESAKLTPGKYSGMDLYLAEMAKYFPHELPGEASLAGWVDAAMFVAGLRLAGREVTRGRVVDALNALEGFTADGSSPRSTGARSTAASARSIATSMSGPSGAISCPFSARPRRCSPASPCPSRPKPDTWS